MRITLGRLVLVSAIAGLVAALLEVPGRRPRRQAPGLSIVRCTLHGIAYDPNLETCPECAKGAPASQPAAAV
jgi:hypothetical protein